MATQTDVRRIALSLPGTRAIEGRFGFSVRSGAKEKGFVWVWQERVDPKKARVPNPGVLVLRVGGLDEKEMLLALDSEKFFTEPHYDGYAAILVRLSAVGVRELRMLITQSWRSQAPKAKPARSKKAPPARRRR